MRELGDVMNSLRRMLLAGAGNHLITVPIIGVTPQSARKSAPVGRIAHPEAFRDLQNGVYSYAGRVGLESMDEAAVAYM